MCDKCDYKESFKLAWYNCWFKEVFFAFDMQR